MQHTDWMICFRPVVASSSHTPFFVLKGKVAFYTTYKHTLSLSLLVDQPNVVRQCIAPTLMLLPGLGSQQ